MEDFETEWDFSSDEAARRSMKRYIRKHFSNILGEKDRLLYEPGGLEELNDWCSKEMRKSNTRVLRKLQNLIHRLLAA